jgi:hypothetical protein
MVSRRVRNKRTSKNISEALHRGLRAIRDYFYRQQTGEMKRQVILILDPTPRVEGLHRQRWSLASVWLDDELRLRFCLSILRISCELLATAGRPYWHVP